MKHRMGTDWRTGASWRWAGAVCLALLSALIGCAERKPQLNIFTFTGYLDLEVVADFERKYECKVVLDYFNSGDAVTAKLSGGGAAVYDIVCSGDGETPGNVKLGLFAPLRRENLPNLRNLDPEFTRGSTDPEHRYTVPYAWFVTGIYARRPKDRPLDETWSLLFDPAKQRGSFLLVDESRTAIAVALAYQGRSVNSTNAGELLQVRDILLDAKRRSVGFDAVTALQNRVRAGDAAMALSFSGMDTGANHDPECYFFVPREGSFVGVDCLAIPAQAPNRDLAEKFLNYLLDAEVGAKNSLALGAPTPNAAARALLPEAVRGDPGIYPPPEVMRRLQFIGSIEPFSKLYDEIWTQIKAR